MDPDASRLIAGGITGGIKKHAMHRDSFGTDTDFIEGRRQRGCHRLKNHCSGCRSHRHPRSQPILPTNQRPWEGGCRLIRCKEGGGFLSERFFFQHVGHQGNRRWLHGAGGIDGEGEQGWRRLLVARPILERRGRRKGGAGGVLRGENGGIVGRKPWCKGCGLPSLAGKNH